MILLIDYFKQIDYNIVLGEITMLKIECINNIMQIVKMEIIKKENHYYVLDHENNQVYLLSEKDGYYQCHFDRDDVTYFLQISNQGIMLSNNQNEKMVLSTEGFLYEKRDKQAVYNQALIEVTNSYLNFYLNDNITDKNSTSIKTYRGFQYLKLSNTVQQDGIWKKDMVIQKENGKNIQTMSERKYSKSGALEYGDTQREELFDSIDDMIQQEIIQSQTVKTLFDRLNNINPNISEYLSLVYEHFGIIYHGIQQNTK